MKISSKFLLVFLLTFQCNVSINSMSKTFDRLDILWEFATLMRNIEPAIIPNLSPIQARTLTKMTLNKRGTMRWEQIERPIKQVKTKKN